MDNPLYSTYKSVYLHQFMIPLFPIRKFWIISIDGKEDARVDKETSDKLTALHEKK